MMVKIKVLHYRPGEALRVPGGGDSQDFFRQSGQKCSKVVSLEHRLPLPPRAYSWYSFVTG